LRRFLTAPGASRNATASLCGVPVIVSTLLATDALVEGRAEAGVIEATPMAKVAKVATPPAEVRRGSRNLPGARAGAGGYDVSYAGSTSSSQSAARIVTTKYRKKAC